MTHLIVGILFIFYDFIYQISYPFNVVE